MEFEGHEKYAIGRQAFQDQKETLGREAQAVLDAYAKIEEERKEALREIELCKQKDIAIYVFVKTVGRPGKLSLAMLGLFLSLSLLWPAMLFAAAGQATALVLLSGLGHLWLRISMRRLRKKAKKIAFTFSEKTDGFQKQLATFEQDMARLEALSD